MEQTDIELVREARKGRHEAFHELVERYAQPLVRLAATLIPSRTDAEDVVQETFTAAFVSLKKFEGRSSVKTWLYAILFRQAVLFRRKHRMPLRFLADEGSLPAASREGVAGHIAAIDARLDIDAVLALLPEDHRAILVLRELEGLSYEEIAEMLGLRGGRWNRGCFGRGRRFVDGFLNMGDWKGKEVPFSGFIRCGKAL